MQEKIVAVFIAILPFCKLRIFLWRNICKYNIDYNSKIAWGNIICCKNVDIKNSKIGYLNRFFVRTLEIKDEVEIRNYNNFKFLFSMLLHEKSQIISKNSIVGFDFLKEGAENPCSCFELGRTSLVTNGHSIDATENVYIGRNVVFGGKGTQLWTHGFDIYRNMVCKPVRIGNDIYIGSMSLLCQGITIADKSVIGAGTCVSSSIEESGFYVSNQLIRKSDIHLYK